MKESLSFGANKVDKFKEPVINYLMTPKLISFISNFLDNVITGNKMDSLNLATLFAPNLMHSFNDDLSKGNCPMSLNSDRMDHVSALKLLVERRDLIYQVPSVELNDAYFYLNDHFPDVLDALLRRRSALAGVEIPEDFQIEEESDKSFDLCRR